MEKVIKSHYANIYAKKDEKGNQPFVKAGGTIPIWFPHIENDVLLYLGLMGCKERFPFIELRKDKWISFVDLQDELKNVTARATGLPGTTHKQSKDNGDYYEHLLSSTTIIASRYEGVQGCSIDTFLRGLIFQLTKRTKFEKIVIDERANGFLKSYEKNVGNKKIPFLSPPNQQWPDYLNDLGLFGNCTRTETNNVIDFDTDSFLFGEARFRKKIGISGLVEILDKANSKMRSKKTKGKQKISRNDIQPFYLVFLKVLENGVFTSDKRFECYQLKLNVDNVYEMSRITTEPSEGKGASNEDQTITRSSTKRPLEENKTVVLIVNLNESLDFDDEAVIAK